MNGNCLGFINSIAHCCVRCLVFTAVLITALDHSLDGCVSFGSPLVFVFSCICNCSHFSTIVLLSARLSIVSSSFKEGDYRAKNALNSSLNACIQLHGDRTVTNS